MHTKSGAGVLDCFGINLKGLIPKIYTNRIRLDKPKQIKHSNPRSSLYIDTKPFICLVKFVQVQTMSNTLAFTYLYHIRQLLRDN